MPASHVQVLHDDGRWYVAELLHQYREAAGWRAVVRYSVGPGLTYQRGQWAADLRPVVRAHDDHEKGDGEGARCEADGRVHPSQRVAWILPHGRRE
jgi:hypothetical protein